MFEHLPEKFKEIISVGFGVDGKRWLVRLPEIIGEIEENWSLSVKAPFPNLSYHYVAPCICAGGEKAVLKIGFPGEKATTLSEIRMLKFLDGNSVCRLLRFDETRSALLLERLLPGENLKTVCKNDDKKAVEIAISVMREFWQKPPEKNDFPKLEDWFIGFEKAEKTEFTYDYIKKARGFFEELTALSAQKTLLHGDFHHENILSASRETFLAIDPKGIVGDIGYDLSVFMINHADWLKDNPNRREKLNDAIRLFSEAFEIEPQNIRKWIFAFSVLSAWWTFEENSENWRNELDSAEIWDV
ncbi:MAG: aminoglycoside phosphotransferase family protein [Pyrinomonadaceae bacterium]